MRSRKLVLVATCCAVLAARSVGAQGHVDLKAALGEIMKADLAFNQAVADHDFPRFLSMIAESAIFGGGTADEVHGREAIGKGWAPMFLSGGPALAWRPTRGEALGGGDLGYTVGTWERRARTEEGVLILTHGNYLTVWRKDLDGVWRAVYDTGSPEP